MGANKHIVAKKPVKMGASREICMYFRRSHVYSLAPSNERENCLATFLRSSKIHSVEIPVTSPDQPRHSDSDGEHDSRMADKAVFNVHLQGLLLLLLLLLATSALR